MFKVTIVAAVAALFTIQSFALDVVIAAKADDMSRPTILGTSNLPDGTTLIVTVARSQIGFEGSSRSLVSGGTFKAGPFGPIDGLTPGAYKLEVMMPIPSMQSESVRSVIGERGEKLTGKLVKRSEFKEKHIVYNSSFKIAGQVDTQRDQAKKQADEGERRLAFCTDGCRVQAGGTSHSFKMCVNSCMRP